MKLFFISAVLCFNLTFTQTVYESIESNALGVKRELKIQLPRNYESNPDKNYPLIVVFDGDYLFEVVAGNIDYSSYWQDMPEAIVVGVNQVGSRSEDCNISSDYSLSKSATQDIDGELLPCIVLTINLRNYDTTLLFYENDFVKALRYNF